MRGHWTYFAIGLALGAGAGFLMGQRAVGGKPGTGVTGSVNAPFQRFLSRG